MSYRPSTFEDFIPIFSSTSELSSVAIGGKVVSVSDEFFAEAFHLLLVEPPRSLKGQFGPKGALYSGWETRRHNPSYDWCIVKLGTAGTVLGFDVDTTHFNGNEAPKASVEALLSSHDPTADDPRWTEILPKVNLGPSSRYLFQVPESSCVNYVKLNIYPDGGVARFRVYGRVTPIFPKDVKESFDLAHVFAGGLVQEVSDQHYGVGSNLILPGRGHDMSDGWETKRSRQEGHKDWVTIRLGTAGILEYVEIDTAHYMGNFPESCEMHALACDLAASLKNTWTQILPRTKLGPHRRHFFALANVAGRVYTHVKLTIYPDGGVKRVRVVGRRAEGDLARDTILMNGVMRYSTMAADGDAQANGIPQSNGTETGSDGSDSPLPESTAYYGPTSDRVTLVPALPLTPEAFAPFGHVLQAYADRNAAPRGTKVSLANAGTATKFHKLAPVLSSYPPGSGASTALSIYRCEPVRDAREVRVSVLERHPFTNQAFVPMGGACGGGGQGGDALVDPGRAYLVVVAATGADDGPDLTSLRAFVASAGQGVVYGSGVWHQPMTVLDKAMDFTCVETQIGNGDRADCEILELDERMGAFKVKIRV